MEAIARLTFGWFGTQTAYLAISQIDPMDFALLTFRIKRVAIGRIEQDIKAVATGKRSPIAIANVFLTWNAAWSDPVFVVLQAASNSEIRSRLIERDPIIFSRRNLVQMIPVLAAGKTLVHTPSVPSSKRWQTGGFGGLFLSSGLGGFGGGTVPG